MSSFDEISLHRGHGRYVFVISAPELGLVLDVLPNCDEETLEKWLDERGKDWCAAVEVACSDMWDAYQNVAAAKLPNARCLAWVTQVEACKYKALKAFAKTLRNWWTQILNYFTGRHNNGFAEGVNLKIKMLNRRGYGYRNFDSFRLHVLVSFG